MTDQLIQQIVVGISRSEKMDESKKSMSVTNIPFFDINYEQIYLEGKKSKREIKVAHVEENLTILKKIFGIKKELTSLSIINNQSMLPLEYSFPELKKMKSQEELSDTIKNVLEDVDNKSYRHKVSYQSLAKEDNLDSHHLLAEKSQIIDTIFSNRIESAMPGSLHRRQW